MPERLSKLHCARRGATDEEKAMPNSPLASHDDEATILEVELADEVLEATAEAGALSAFTLGSCTGLSVCPG